MHPLRLLLTAIIVSVSIGAPTAQDAPTISGAEVRIDGLLGSSEAGAAPTTPWGHPRSSRRLEQLDDDTFRTTDTGGA